MPSERPLRVLIFGASGQVGRRVVAEALRRGHRLTGVVRDPATAADLPEAVTLRSGDARRADEVRRLADGHDVIVSATRPAAGREPELVQTALALVNGLRGLGKRLVLIGGAASLRVPGQERLALDDATIIPAPWRPIAEACAEQYAVCVGVDELAWTYVSPPAELAPGERRGTYRLGTDELVVDAEGNSRISLEDFAVAILDEIESPRHLRCRFTVGYGAV